MLIVNISHTVTCVRVCACDRDIGVFRRACMRMCNCVHLSSVELMADFSVQFPLVFFLSD